MPLLGVTPAQAGGHYLAVELDIGVMAPAFAGVTGGMDWWLD